MCIRERAIYNVFTLRFIGHKLAIVTGWIVVTLCLVVWGGAWTWFRDRSQITVVLMELPESSLAKVTSTIREKVPHVRAITYLSKADGLKKVSEAPGFKDWGMWLSDNPVPPVLLVKVPPRILMTDHALEVCQAIQNVPGVHLVVGEIPALRMWFLVYMAGGILVLMAWAAGGWTMSLALSFVAVAQMTAVRGSLQQLKSAGATFPWALSLSQKKQTMEWLAVSGVTMALIAAVLAWMAPALTGIGIQPLVVWVVTCGVALGIGWWQSRRVWRSAVNKVWEELS